MPASLPPRPSLRFLQLQAKALLKAQRQAAPQVCDVLRSLARFREASDADILQARVQLHEAQLALALHYGFPSWPDLRRHLQRAVAPGDCSLEAVLLRTPDEIPEYAAAGVPLAVVAALNHAGEPIDFVDFAAGTGWALSFGYRYDDISPAHLAVRGRPGRDGPLEVFSFLPQRLGFDYDMAPTADVEALWPFVVRHVDAGTPVISEHLDGGLITGYRGEGAQREVAFDGPVGAGWIAADGLQPFAVYVLVRRRPADSPRALLLESLQRAAAKAAPHTWEGVPQGLAALEAYADDVAQPDRDFAQTEEWFCWAAFQRLLARQCAAVWLRRVAAQFAPPVSQQLLHAAERYAEACSHYEQYRRLIAAGEPSAQSLPERARTPERIAAILPALQAGIAAETRGAAQLQAAAKLAGAGHGSHSG